MKSVEEIKKYLYNNAWRYTFLYIHKEEIREWENDHWLIRLLQEFLYFNENSNSRITLKKFK